MSNSAPSGDISPFAALATTAPEVEDAPAPIDTGMRLVLPDPLPADANPFRVIDWILFTAHVAAVYLTDARQERVDQLGRKMRTEDRGGVLMLHWEDDVDRRAVESKLSRQILSRWWEAHRNARNLCAGFGIPFDVYDPLLKAAWDKLNEAWVIMQGVADKEVYPDRDINHRLHELADSTTPTITPATGTKQGEGKTPLPDPYAELRQFARTNLKGQERAVVDALCDAGGELLIADLAVAGGVGWDDPFSGFRNAQQRLNPKLKPLGWTLARQNNAAKLNPMKS